jgi:glycerol transport system substrate-binding protein
MKIRNTIVALAAFGTFCTQIGWAGENEAKRWAEREFQPSTLDKFQQERELKWFIDASQRLRSKGVKGITVVSEMLATHDYESKVLAKAFEEITGIRVQHELIAEGEVVERFQSDMQSGKSRYDGWVTDSDLIGTHYRYGKVLNLSDYMTGAGVNWTNPGLDLKDFIGLKFTTAADYKLYQLPDQQFANLYWFRADLFARTDLKERFKTKYGYELGVPLNWSAYEDIAAFFTNDVQTIDGKAIYGHMDYGKKDPSLGWRFTDAWLSMAGVADEGYPNGRPVDEWGIRSGDGANKCVPVGASVSRGGATNSAPAVFALQKYIDWLKKYAPKDAINMTFGEAGPVPAQGQIAQQIFWYTAFTADMIKKGLPVVNTDGTPKWRMAPGPVGPYWRSGMQNGYQDVGAWTFFKNHDADQVAAAWLYAQFVTSKTVSLKKSIVGLTFIRTSDIRHDYFTENAAKYGGLIEFYRSPARIAWTPTGMNVPDYPKLAQLWWKNIAQAVGAERTAQQALDNLAEEMDQVMGQLERAGMAHCPPKLNPKGDPAKWLTDYAAPRKQLLNEQPPGKTVDYQELLQAWREWRVR